MRAVQQIVLSLVLGVAATWVVPAAAQLVLPGAVAPTPEGATQSPKAAAPRARPRRIDRPREPAAADAQHVNRGIPVTVPGVSTLAGKVLSLNGGPSQMTFGLADNTIAVTRLSLTGEKISDSQEVCRVEVAAPSLAVTPLGRSNGLERFQLALTVCPVTFGVLNGAILIDGAQPACSFKEADCEVPLTGLWGPAPGELGPDKLKGLERIRAAADQAVRGNYKALTAATKDRPTVMAFAREQAQFSSSREETCRSYADEGRHGFCAAQLTQARAAQLHDEVAVAVEAKIARIAARKAAHAGR